MKKLNGLDKKLNPLYDEVMKVMKPDLKLDQGSGFLMILTDDDEFQVIHRGSLNPNQIMNMIEQLAKYQVKLFDTLKRQDEGK